MTQLERLQKTGIRRLGTQKQGFRYETPHGRSLTAADRDRVEALKIPPAWTDVFVHPSPRGMLQAVGKDVAGRWQYLYHAARVQRREREKYEKIVHFAEALPRLRKTVKAHLRQPGLRREKVLACILRILSTVFIRPGSQVYADENGSYGVATLRKKHVKVKGDLVEFDFPGKSGKRQRRELRDRQVARIVRQLRELPGHEVFKFVGEDGRLVDVKRRHVNQYIKEVMGERFSAKDFRTWAGTLICACALARAGTDASDTRTARKKKVLAAVKETAEQLGNTAAICRASYIYPAVLNSFERGLIVDRYFDTTEELVDDHSRGLHSQGLHGAEKALLQLLKRKAA